MKNNRILAIVVTYYPEKELLERNLFAFIDKVDKVLIWENTSEDEKLSYRFINHQKAEYCGDGINSISHALNYAWHYAERNHYEYLLTMDQDSVFKNFTDYLNETIKNPQAPKGIWSPTMILLGHRDTREKGIRETPMAITSGMLIHVSLMEKIGGWNEAFSVDGIDAEFCFCAKKKGVNTYQINRTHLYHQFGKQKRKSFWGHDFVLDNYCPLRYYMIYKSHVLVMRMYPEQKWFKAFFYQHRLKMICWIFLFEEHGFEKFCNILKGIIMGRLCKKPMRKN